MTKILGKYIFLILITTLSIFGNSEFALSMKSNKNRVFAGEPIIVSVTMSAKAGSIIDLQRYEKPEFNGFIAREAKSSTTTIDNGFEKTVINYMLTPLNVGTFNIKPAKVAISVQNSTQSIEFMGIVMQSSSPIIKNIASNSLNIIVKPAPKNIDLIGNFDITAVTNLHQSKANQPVILTLKTEGNGIVEDMRDLDYNLDNVTTYSNKPKISQDFSNNRLKSLYIKEYIFISDHNFTIPAQKILIFDPVINRTIEKVLPSKKIIITGVTNADQNDVLSEHNDRKLDMKTSSFFIGFIGFVLGISCVLFIRWIMLRKSNKQKVSLGKNNISKLLPYAKIDSDVDCMIRQLYAKQKGDKSIKIDNKKLKQLLAKYKSEIR